MGVTKGYKSNTYNTNRVANKYVIVYYRNGKINFLADRDISKWVWTSRIHKAKCYEDLSAADIKTSNLKYDMNTDDIKVRYVTSNLKLVEPRRYRHDR